MPGKNTSVTLTTPTEMLEYYYFSTKLFNQPFFPELIQVWQNFAQKICFFIKMQFLISKSFT